jgi:hypothetical protein
MLAVEETGNHMLDSGRRIRLKFDYDTKTIVIPTTVTVLTKDSFEGLTSVEIVAFAVGSQIRRLETATFEDCCLLRTICIAASVEFIGRNCFVNPLRPRHSSLETVTFELGSKLREIELGAFYGCISLKRLRIPASVEKMTSGSLPESRPFEVLIDSGNPYFCRDGGFVMTVSHDHLIRCSRAGSEVTVPDEIERIDDSCFRFRDSIHFVIFGQLSRLSSIGNRGFAACENLKTISIPSSVTFLGDDCFMWCKALETVSFCDGSQLDSIPARAFFACYSLESIILPSSVKTLGKSCFSGCGKLVNWPLPPDSEAVRIEDFVFVGCSSLTSMVLPSSLEFLGVECFESCHSIESLSFASPSHLRELLDLPPGLSGLVSIPDSVEVLSFCPDWQLRPQRVFTFGSESKLKYFSAESKGRLRICRSFVQVPSQSLKIFRMRMEFE